MANRNDAGVGNVYTTEPVLTEALYLLGPSARAQHACIEFILAGGAALVPQSAASLARAAALMTRIRRHTHGFRRRHAGSSCRGDGHPGSVHPGCPGFSNLSNPWQKAVYDLSKVGKHAIIRPADEFAPASYSVAEFLSSVAPSRFFECFESWRFRNPSTSKAQRHLVFSENFLPNEQMGEASPNCMPATF